MTQIGAAHLLSLNQGPRLPVQFVRSASRACARARATHGPGCSPPRYVTDVRAQRYGRVVDACFCVICIVVRAHAVMAARVEEGAGDEIREKSVCVEFRKDIYADDAKEAGKHLKAHTWKITDVVS